MAADKPDPALSLTAFLETSPAGFEWTDPKAGQSKIDPDSPRNIKGPIEIGYAVEKTIPGGADASSTKSARAVILGSTMFAINANLQVAGNVDLLKNSVHWASGAQEKIGIAAKDPTINSITITERQAVWIGLLTAVVFPGAIGGTGLGVWWRRRRR